MSQEISIGKFITLRPLKILEFLAFIVFAVYLISSANSNIAPPDISQQPAYVREYETLQKTFQVKYAKEPFPSEQYEKVVVTRIVDGDTIRVTRANGDEAAVRYIGIDTPEIDRSEAQNHDPFALEAQRLNEYLVSDKTVYLLADSQDTDKYGRLLRYVYTEDGIFVNHALIRLGLAQLLTIPPNVAYQPDFYEAQQQAISERLYLFQSY
ncbi:MAG: thermonuclease family protein [Candidatus Dojkabacteria bacterium]|nr:MAG: thermonuclease family protein [Candidatus Dojkabacteria bacterium]